MFFCHEKCLQEARALLGKLEYQRGNVEGALRVFDGIDLQAAIQRLQPCVTEKMPPKKDVLALNLNMQFRSMLQTLFLKPYI